MGYPRRGGAVVSLRLSDASLGGSISAWCRFVPIPARSATLASQFRCVQHPSMRDIQPSLLAARARKSDDKSDTL
jgi:hypothetical protein